MQFVVRFEHTLVGEEAAHDVLREVGAVDAQDQVLGTPGGDLLLLLQRLGMARQVLELGDVDADRVVAHPDGTAFVEHRLLAVVDGEAHVLLAGQQEVAHVTTRLEADDVVAEDALHDAVAHALGQDLPVLRRGPGDVHELLDARAEQFCADELRDAVELVVLHHHQRRLVTPLRLGDDALGEQTVDLLVAVSPGALGGGVEDGLAAQVPQVVLDEPQQRVADHVVVEVVRLGRRLDEGDPVGGAVLGVEPRGLAVAGAGRETAIVLVARGGDPDRVGGDGQRAHRRDQPAGAPHQLLRGAPDGVGALQAEGRPVGDDDRLDVPQQTARVGLDSEQGCLSSTGRPGTRRPSQWFCRRLDPTPFMLATRHRSGEAQGEYGVGG